MAWPCLTKAPVPWCYLTLCMRLDCSASADAGLCSFPSPLLSPAHSAGLFACLYRYRHTAAGDGCECHTPGEFASKCL
jgi:hypothetical protein